MAKKALLIGINRYRILGADLRGCVNDVNNMKSVLTQTDAERIERRLPNPWDLVAVESGRKLRGAVRGSL